jgi:peptide/nickel transport system substrate-binding protein
MAAQLFQESLAELGIEVVLDDVEWGVFVQAQKEKDKAWDMTSIWVSTPVAYGGSQLFLIGHSSQQGIGRNWSFYDNPEFDALLEEAKVLSPEDARLDELLCRAQQMLIDDAVLIPVMVSQIMDLTRTELKEFEYDPYGYPADLHIYEMYLEEGEGS